MDRQPPDGPQRHCDEATNYAVRDLAGSVSPMVFVGTGRHFLYRFVHDHPYHFSSGSGAAIFDDMDGPAAVRSYLVFRWEERLRRSQWEDAIVLLRPARTAIRVTLVIVAVLFWLDNIGLKVSTLLAGLGVGGLAFALAAQDTLKNLLGSIMILRDKPYKVGQRIVAKGHDGIVEEIGLRSTRLRLLTGHQTTIPNEEMAKIDIENIGLRPHIRRLASIGITYDTPPEKIEKAVEIILKILGNHEGMDPELPPRAYFSEYNPYSLNISVLYWYHPADYWGYKQARNLGVAGGFFLVDNGNSFGRRTEIGIWWSMVNPIEPYVS